MTAALVRFACYGVLGWGAEVFWTGVSGLAARPVDWRLRGYSTLWMFPIYGSAVVLFEPLHQALRASAWPLRGAAYVAGIWLVEYVSHGLVARVIRRPPWDYSYARWHLHGRIRWDYAPLWFVFGLGLERVHDALRAAGPVLVG